MRWALLLIPLVILAACTQPETKTSQPVNWAENKYYCDTDADCAPATCCHPSECVNINFEPDPQICEDTACTQDCVRGSMDCCSPSACACRCANNKCKAELNTDRLK